jgi:Secretion system C-terminal sorting domain
MKKNVYNKNILRSLGVVLFVCLTNLSFAATYYSISSAVISATASWNSARDGSGTAPANFTTLGDIFIIQGTGGLSGAPHAMTLATTGMTMTGVTLEIEGAASLTNSAGSATPFIIGAGSTFKLNANSTYTHGGNGSFSSLFGGTEMFASTSNFIINPTAAITGPSTVTCGSNFGNLSYTGVGSMQCNSVLPNIDGDLTVNVPTGTTGELRLAASAGNSNLTIKGNLNLIGGITSTFSFGNGSSVGTINLEGNFNMTGGVFQTAATGGISGSEKICNINFTKAGTQTFTKTGGTITANTSSFRRIVFTVKSSSTLDMGINILNCVSTGQVDFITEAGSTVKLGDVGGIVAFGSIATTGNIQTSATSNRTFNVGSNYEYTGSAPQTTGTGLPATVNSLTINNAAGVTLSAPTTVTGALTLTSGSLTLNSQALTMASGSMVKGTGTIIGDYTHPAGSTLAPGASPGTVTINGALTNIGDWAIEIGGATAGTQFDQVLATGATTLTSGTINVSLISGYDPPLGTAFIILDAASLTGTFTAINLPALLGGKTWATPVYDNALGTVTISINTVLSTELVSFTAKTNGNTNLLAWKTANEKDNAAFQIERSANGVQFTNIGTVKGNGTKASASDYTFLDEGPLSISYYRLVSVDNNGKKETSNVVTVLRGTNGKTKLYPTLVSDKMTIVSDSNEPQSFNIFDLTGRNVQRGTFTTQQEISVNNLATGTYILKVGSDAVKFIKQ